MDMKMNILCIILTHYYVRMFWSTECLACPNYEVVRTVQPEIQPQAADTPVLYPG